MKCTYDQLRESCKRALPHIKETRPDLVEKMHWDNLDTMAQFFMDLNELYEKTSKYKEENENL